MITVFGGTGFIGGKYCETYKTSIAVRKGLISSPTENIIDFVSTVDNYNVKTDPHLDINTNLNLLIDKLEWARENHGQDTVYNFISSWFVYGNTTHLPAREDSPCFPTGFYSATKLCAEQLLASYCMTHKMKYRILRLGNVIGVGDRKISNKKNALQFMIRELSQGREINLYEKDSIRDYIDVRDCVSAIDLVVRKGELNQIYNISNGRGLSIHDLIDYAHIASGYAGKINIVPVPEFHKIVQTRQMWMDNAKLKNLGYIQQYDIKQSVASLAEYYKNESR